MNLGIGGLFVATILAIVVSAFMGAFATGAMTFGVREIRESLDMRRRRERFRASLIGEIDSGMENIGASYVDRIGSELVPTSVFTTETDDLGLLNEEEISCVTSYYASARNINSISKRISLNPEEAVSEIESDSFEDGCPPYAEELPLADAYYSECDIAIKRGEKAVSELRENKSKTGLRAYLNDVTNIFVPILSI